MPKGCDQGSPQFSFGRNWQDQEIDGKNDSSTQSICLEIVFKIVRREGMSRKEQALCVRAGFSVFPR